METQCSIDPDRVYLTGHSMGGWGTWWIGLRHPDLFASICPMAGFPEYNLLSNARNLAPFILHDSLDDVVPVENSRGPAAKLPELGISIQYREETGYKHASRIIGDTLPSILEWFNAHPRIQRPQRVSLVSRTPAAASAYWVRMLDLADPPHHARIDADVNTSVELVLSAVRVKSLAVNLDALPTSATEPLQIIIGKKRFTAGKKRGWSVLTQIPPNAWKCDVQVEPPAAADAALLTGKASESLKAAASDQDRLATTVATLLREATDAEVCVLDAEFLKLPAGRDLTADMVLDLFAHPYQSVARFRCKREALAKTMEVLPGPAIKVFPAGSTDLPGECTVVTPITVARKLPGFDPSRDVLPDTIGEILYRVCREKD